MKRITFVIAAILAVLLTACETDVDIIGDYEDTTVVYGLLNQDSNTFIKVNKAFLGQGNALIMAKIEDSSLYSQNLNVLMEEWDEDNMLRTITLHDTVIDNKEEGVFYNPYQMLYHTDAQLNDEYSYKLRVQVGDTKEVTATTNLVNNFGIIRPIAGGDFVKFLEDSHVANVVEWTLDRNAKVFEVLIRFNYKEKSTGQDTILRKMDWYLGSITINNQSIGSDLEVNYFASDFYELCMERIPYDDPAKEQNVSKRLPVNVEFIFSVAAEEFATYLQVNGPSNSIVQDRPQYTNIENGIGLFSSRYIKKRVKLLHPDSYANLEEMEIRF